MPHSRPPRPEPPGRVPGVPGRWLRRHPWLGLLVTASMGASLLCCGNSGCRGLRRAGIATFSDDYEQTSAPDRLEAKYVGRDRDRPRVEVALVEVASGFDHPTDLRFVPGKPDTLVVLEKDGKARWVSLADPGLRGQWLSMDVLTVSEQGLLGIAFDPAFRDNGRLYLNATVAHEDREVSEISAWRVQDPGAFPGAARPRQQRVLLRVTQPYQNHNAGQLQFGPDGHLYIGFGDGGHQGDPHDHGQDLTTMLGAMLRIDVRNVEGKTPYRVPADNPFINKRGARPEIWAYGLRNPWRYSFDPDGRLIVADVGQNAWEEIDVVHAGDNLGWSIHEGRHCYDEHPRCGDEALVPPIYEYDHQEGQSITGGHVYTATGISDLSGLYVFGDFVSGRMWAIPLPEAEDKTARPTPRALGQWPISPVAFTTDTRGELYVADFVGGGIYRIASPGGGPGQ